MLDSHSEKINRAQKLLAEAIDLLDQVRRSEDGALKNLPESSQAFSQKEYSLGYLEDAIGELVNIEDWLESAGA